MSFMFNPFPYEDLSPINRPKLSTEVTDSVVSGTKEVSGYISVKNKKLV